MSFNAFHESKSRGTLQYSYCNNLRIEMQMFSLHLMMQNIRLIDVFKPKVLLRDIKKQIVCIIQCKSKTCISILIFTSYIYVLYYQSDMSYTLTTSLACCPFKIMSIKTGVFKQPSSKTVVHNVMKFMLITSW